MDKCGKGLRHFSMKVCEKVRNKGTTTYNEVADELVAEFTNPAVPPIMEQVRNGNICAPVQDTLINLRDVTAIRPKEYSTTSVRRAERTDGDEYYIERKEGDKVARATHQLSARVSESC